MVGKPDRPRLVQPHSSMFGQITQSTKLFVIYELRTVIRGIAAQHADDTLFGK